MISTKLLIPRVNPSFIQRPSLCEKLCSGLKRKLIHISAPAGFGKTSLVSEWINRFEISASWYSLDKRDNDPVVFLNYIVAGLRTLDQNIGKRTQDLINAPQRPEIESIIELLIDDIQRIPADFLLVLDDYHLIDSVEVHRVIRMILEHMPAQMHLAILSRSNIPIPLARTRSRNELLELRSSELNFSEQETVTLFNKNLKLGLSHQEIAMLLLKTEGWIAGLQLTALSIQNTDNISGFISDFAGDNRYIMDYLMEEVLGCQTEDIKDFLLKTSILEQLSGPLCDYLLDRNDSQAMLEFLDKNNLFIIPLDAGSKWYRYHHLFGDLLKQRLYNSQKIDSGELHRRASTWFHKNQRPTLAIDHSLENKDYSQAIQLLNTELETLWEKGHHGAIMKYGSLFPKEILESSPRLCIFYSWALINGGMFLEAEPVLLAAQKALSANHEDNDLPGKLAVAFAYLYSSSGNVGSVLQYCNKATALVRETQTIWNSWAWYSCGLGNMMIGNLQESARAFGLSLEAAMITGNLYLIATIGIRFAFCELQGGNFKSAYKKCQNLVAGIREADYSLMTQNEWSFAGLYSTMGYIEHEWARGEALKNSKLGYELSCKGNDLTSRVFNTIVYIRVLRYHGELRKVESLIGELDTLQRDRELFPYLLYTFYALKLSTFVHFQQRDKASRYAESLHLASGDKVDENNELLYTSYARLLLSESRVSEAETILNSLHTLAETANRRERLVEIKVLLAVLHQILENEELASDYLAQSLALAEEENLLMHFINDGQHIALLLNTQYRNYQTRPYSFSKKFLDKVIRAIEKKVKQADQAFFYSLSKRETEVLRLMAEELSNKEIADQLYVSLNTVKAHAKSIHLKLEVDSRIRAVKKAKELGLV